MHPVTIFCNYVTFDVDSLNSEGPCASKWILGLSIIWRTVSLYIVYPLKAILAFSVQLSQFGESYVFYNIKSSVL